MISSPHAIVAYRRDLIEIARLLPHDDSNAQNPDGTAESGDEHSAGWLAALTAGDLAARAVRGAFARFAAPRSAASVCRAWSTWNQFFNFLVADGVVPGNPMPAVDRPRMPRRSPKPLEGEATPETLPASVAGTTATRRRRGRSGTWR